MKYKFVDIGCSFFDTSVDDYGLDVNGLLVEPIAEHARALPTSATVKVECSAITEVDGTMSMNCLVNENAKYLSKQLILDAFANNDNDSLIKQAKCGEFWKNGSSTLLEKNKIPHEWVNLYQSRTITTLTLKSLFEKYDVTEIDVLKIDVEGYEPVILTQLLNLLKENKIKINEKIIAEYYPMCDLHQLDILLDNICDEFKFKKSFKREYWNEDMILEKI